MCRQAETEQGGSEVVSVSEAEEGGEGGDTSHHDRAACLNDR